jgi:hypothetical protein
MHRRLEVIQIFGTRAAVETATKTFDVMFRRCFGSAEQPASWDDVEWARLAHVDQVRRDLRVSDE